MIEIRVRRFYKCDEGTAIPAVSYIIDEEKVAVPHFDVNAAATRLAKDVADLPGTNWRLMSEDEVDTYRDEEDE